MGLVMVPLMAISVGTLPKEKIGNASGIFNLMRNLGGSIGISISTTFLARMTQTHQANLVGHMTPYDPVFRQRLSALAGGLSRYSARRRPACRPTGCSTESCMQQSNLKAYVDMFCWTAVDHGDVPARRVAAEEGRRERARGSPLSGRPAAPGDPRHNRDRETGRRPEIGSAREGRIHAAKKLLAIGHGGRSAGGAGRL